MGTITIEVRRASAEDADEIATVHESSWRQAYSGILPYRSLNAMLQRRDPKWWSRAIRRATKILVLDIGGEIAGYATLGANRVESLPSEGEIYELYLAPQYQGVGLGARLFMSARRELNALGFQGCVVWVLDENDGGKHFYENAGGRDIAEGAENFDGKTLKKIAYAWD